VPGRWTEPGSDQPALFGRVSNDPEQGWRLSRSGVIVFDDLGEILPEDPVITPQDRAYARLAAAA